MKMTWWTHTHNPILQRIQQGDWEVEASLGHTEMVSKKKKKTTTKQTLKIMKWAQQ